MTATSEAEQRTISFYLMMLRNLKESLIFLTQKPGDFGSKKTLAYIIEELEDNDIPSYVLNNSDFKKTMDTLPKILNRYIAEHLIRKKGTISIWDVLRELKQTSGGS